MPLQFYQDPENIENARKLDLCCKTDKPLPRRLRMLASYCSHKSVPFMFCEGGK